MTRRLSSLALVALAAAALGACAGADSGGATLSPRSSLPATSTLLAPGGQVMTPDPSPLGSQEPLRRP
jgi:hypothetical protein